MNKTCGNTMLLLLRIIVNNKKYFSKRVYYWRLKKYRFYPSFYQVLTFVLTAFHKKFMRTCVEGIADWISLIYFIGNITSYLIRQFLQFSSIIVCGQMLAVCLKVNRKTCEFEVVKLSVTFWQQTFCYSGLIPKFDVFICSK